jgi:hypothetical protein
LQQGFDSNNELHEVLTAAVCGLNMAGGHIPTHIGTTVQSIIRNNDPPQDTNPVNYLDDLIFFADFCNNDYKRMMNPLTCASGPFNDFYNPDFNVEVMA